MDPANSTLRMETRRAKLRRRVPRLPQQDFPTAALMHAKYRTRDRVVKLTKRCDGPQERHLIVPNTIVS